ECVAAAETVGRLLVDLGHEVSVATPPVSGAECKAAVRMVLAAHTANHLDARAAALGRPVRDGEVETITALAAEEGRRLSARDYAAALPAIHRTGRQMARFFDDYDVVVSPTLADPPLPLGAMDMMGDDLDAYLEVMLGHLAFTPVFNLSGCPAASVPLHWAPDRLPVGV
ncbi:MAG: amidase, partial [Actinobacteria bacterium]|nr:amidase [Actinomycetota bacterium]NIS32292.1 amidase [Actinomycetota bacterium]NIU19883.1 amidase [Actinomycetota bacterium]NIU67334.1 amidase [Actinomycetota bacterium]NIW29115.1 amidase [Actinomycetota bacterium]